MVQENRQYIINCLAKRLNVFFFVFSFHTSKIKPSSVIQDMQDGGGGRERSPQRVTRAERLAPVAARREAAGDFGDRLFSNKPQKLEG